MENKEPVGIEFADTGESATQAAFALGGRYANDTWVDSAKVVAWRTGRVVEVKYDKERKSGKAS